MFICRFLSEGTDTIDNPSYLDGINNSIRGCGIVCKSDFLRRATHQSQRKNVKLLSSYPHRFSILPKGDEYDIDKVVDVSLRKTFPLIHSHNK